MARRIVVVGAAMLMVCGAVLGQASAESILINGGAETGDLTGWINDNSGASPGNSWKVSPGSASSSGVIWPYEGDYLFDLGCSFSPGDVMALVQTGTTGLSGPYPLRLSGWFANESVYGDPPDSGEAMLRIYGDGAETQLLASASTGVMSDLPNLTWHGFDIGVDLGELTETPDHWRVDLVAYRNFGSCLDVVYDGMELSVVPEPAMALLGLAGLVTGMVARHRARKRKKQG
jgi:hypothetical protein